MSRWSRVSQNGGIAHNTFPVREQREERRVSRVDEWLLGRVVVVMLLRVVERVE